MDTAVVGTYTITYTVQDLAGNAAEETRTVEVVDTQAPTIYLIGEKKVECGEPYIAPRVRVYDFCDGIIETVIITGDTVQTTVPGDYTVLYTATDAAGNEATEEWNVKVEDTLPPEITVTGSASVTVECGSSYTDAGAHALDLCNGDLSGNIETSGTVDANVPGDYTITYTVTDCAGHTATAQRTVTVQDTQAPTITLNGQASVTIECGTAYTDPGATAQDECEGNVPVTVGGATVNTSVPGVYHITYTAADSSGNAAPPRTRTVTVQDTQPPTITLNGQASVTIECGSSFSDPGATAHDDCDGNITSNIQTAGHVNRFFVGTYIITYTVYDSAGNSAQVSRTVEVVDTTPPVITHEPEVHVECGDTYDPNDYVYSADDLCDGDVLDSLVIGGDTVDTCASGTYTVIYSAHDSHGNVSTATQTVIVEGVPDGFRIETETIALEPTDRTRKTIGVGEEVKLSLIGSVGSCPITWFLEGDGSLDRYHVNEVTFTAHDRASTPTIRVGYCAECILATVQFNVIEPNGVLFENGPGPGGCGLQNCQSIALSYGAYVYVQPDTVNFYRIKLFESFAETQTTGRFSTFVPPNHPPNGPHNMDIFIQGKGSKMFMYDSISGNGGKPPYELETSTATWPIIWSYSIDEADEVDIELVNQIYTLIGHGGNMATFTITKDQSGATISTGGAAQFINP